MKKIYLLLFMILLTIAGCATTSAPPSRISRPKGIYHSVKKGETLSQVARIYNRDLGEIARVNRLSDADQISVGQLLFIPQDTNFLRTAYPKLTDRGESFIWPLKGKIISFHGASQNQLKNKGINIAANEGAIIVAAKSGRVSFTADNIEGYGRIVIIDHSGGYQTVYAYNSENLVKVGQLVTQDTPIAKVGLTGRANQSCLHFEIRNGHRPENPLAYLP